MNKHIFILISLFFSYVSVSSNNIEAIKDSLSEYSGEKKAMTLYNIGTYYYLNNNDSAIFYIDRAFAEYEKIANERGMVKCYGVLGSIYADYGMFDTAVALIVKVIEWGEENNDELAFYAYCELANMYDKMNQNAKAAKFYKKAINGSHLAAKLAGFANLGLLYLVDKEYDSASYYFNGALDEYYKQDTGVAINKYNIAAIYLNLAEVAYGKEEYEKGISLLNKSSVILNEIGNHQALAKVYLNLGKGYGKLQKNELSTRYYFNAKEIADSLHYLLVQEEVYMILTDYYREKGDFENALISLEKYEIAHDSLIILGYKATIAEMEVKYSISEKNKLIVDLKKEKQNMRIRAISVIAGLLLLSLIIILLINHRRLKLKSEKAMVDAKSHLNKVRHDTILREFERMKVGLHEKSAFNEELEEEVKKLSIGSEQQSIEDKIQLLRETRILTDDDWERYNRLFNEVHPLFCNSVENFDDLSNGDRRQIIFLKLGLKQKEIAYLMGITTEGVKRARQRVAKKVGLDNAGELKEYIESV